MKTKTETPPMTPQSAIRTPHSCALTKIRIPCKFRINVKIKRLKIVFSTHP